jgi:adenosylmethionine---8-amino-7-oxononanoate aminotransferase
MADLLDLDRQNIWHPFTPLLDGDPPLLVESAEGIYLHTSDGRKIIDAISSWWVNLHGHSRPEIAKAIGEQAQQLEHVIFAGFTHRPAITLSKNLLSILPDNQSKIFFSDNGSTAVEVAIKLALQFWHNQGIPKKHIIAISGAYHGDTFGAMSVGERGLFTRAFASHMFAVTYIDFPQNGNEEHVFAQFEDSVERGDVAAFIFEPLIQAAAGMRTYSPQVLDRMIGCARENHVVTIADEVFTGFGRTGKFFASEYLENKPDIIALSKGLTGGTLPLGVTSCSDKIISAFRSEEIHKTFFHGHSFTANPLSCAAANASFELLMTPACQEQIATINKLHQEFSAYLRGNKKVKEVRTLGTILSIELDNEETTSYSNPLRKKIYPYFLQRNILLRPLGNVIYIVPPYVIKADELHFVYGNIKEFLDDLQKENPAK